MAATGLTTVTKMSALLALLRIPLVVWSAESDYAARLAFPADGAPLMTDILRLRAGKVGGQFVMANFPPGYVSDVRRRWDADDAVNARV